MAVFDISLRNESRDRYLTYALSVVSGRALPDVRDGLKPVQRRILYAMFQQLRLRPDASYKKSAAVVGEVLARFHPHGDIACYEAMARMAQDFSLRYPLVDGQGNYGSIDGDPPAAYRYTEAKLLPMALQVIGEINEDTVNFVDNFDASVQEPTVLPSRAPNLLMNGASGIAVGMATNIPPHNLRDAIKAAVALLDDPEITIPKLTTFIKGPDFPTACSIVNSKRELNAIYQSGKGAVRMRGTWSVEEEKRGKKQVVVDSIPYGVNKSHLVEKIASLIIDKKVPQLLDVRDESTEKIRVVLELASDANPEVAMAYLFKNSPLETLFQVNLTCLAPTGENGAIRPELLSLKQMLQHFLDFRRDVVVRRLQFEKRNLLDRIHILEGFIIIFDALDEAIKIVRKSSGRSDAAEKLRKRFKLSEIQAFAIVDLRIYQLSKTNIEDVRAELEEKKKRVKQIESILKSKTKITNLIKSDLEQVQTDFGDNRRSKIIEEDEPIELNESDYVIQEEVYAIVTEDGWVKRIRQTNDYTSTRVREGDRILRAHPLSTVDYVCFVTSLGYLYTLRVTDFPSSSGYGSPLSKLLKFRDGETLVESFALESPDFESAESEYEYLIKDGQVLHLVSKNGVGFGIILESLIGIKRNGKRVMKFRAGDSLAGATKAGSSLAMFTKKGSALVVKSKEVPERAQAAVGVSLMGVRKDDDLIAVQGFTGKTNFEIEPTSGKVKVLSSSKLTSGRRGLKGTKVISRGEIEGVRKL